MKKLNRKGFTLVELLAVIVILAIVVGITLVTVLPTLKNSRQQAFEVTPQTAADYLEKQYQMSLIGTVGFTIPITATAITAQQLKDAGLKPENYVYGTWFIQTNGRACVKLYASTTLSEAAGAFNLAKTTKKAGEYYDATEISAATAIPVYTSATATTTSSKSFKYSMAQSSGC